MCRADMACRPARKRNTIHMKFVVAMLRIFIYVCLRSCVGEAFVNDVVLYCAVMNSYFHLITFMN